MNSSRTAASITLALVVCATADAAVIAYGTQADFTAAMAAQSLTPYAQDFTSFSGSYAGVSGTINGVQWAASSSNLLVATSGILSTTDQGDAITINFSGTPTTAVGGSFFSLNGSGLRISAVALVRLTDGQSFLNQIGGGQFRGFVSDGAAIASITLTPYTNYASRPSMERIIVGAVPAPGALALLAAAGLAGSRRRRA